MLHKIRHYATNLIDALLCGLSFKIEADWMIFMALSIKRAAKVEWCRCWAIADKLSLDNTTSSSSDAPNPSTPEKTDCGINICPAKPVSAIPASTTRQEKC